MTHEQVFKEFKEHFPTFVNDKVIYFPTGKNGIRIRHLSHVPADAKECVYTTDGKGNWRFETVRSFMKNTLDVDVTKKRR